MLRRLLYKTDREEHCKTHFLKSLLYFYQNQVRGHQERNREGGGKGRKMGKKREAYLERTGRGVREKKERGGWGENGEKEGERETKTEIEYLL